MNFKSIMFLVIIGLILFSISPENANFKFPDARLASATSQEIISTKYVPNGYVESFANGTHLATLGPSSIQNGTDSSGNPTYGPYVFTQNSTGYLVQTGDGSLFFDKTTCEGYFYKAGIINATNNSPVLQDRFFMLQKNQASSSWTVENQVTNQTCSTNVIQNPRYIEIDGTRDDPNMGSVTVKYIKSYGNSFVSVISAKNENALWQNNNIAIEERMSVPSSIVFNETAHDLSTLKNLNLSYQQLLSFYHKDIDFMPSPYALLLDKDMGSFNNISFSYNPNSRLVDAVVDYTRNPSVTTLGNSFTVDPTLAYSTGTQWDINSQGPWPYSACYNVSPTYYNTIASSTNTIIYQTYNAYCEGRVLKIDISSIPSNATISSISFQYNVSSIYSSPPPCALIDIMDNPSTASASTIWSDMYSTSIRNNHISVSSDSQCDTAGGPYTDNLASTPGIADMDTQLANDANFFAIAMTFGSSATNSYVDYPIINGFQMQVMYTVPNLNISVGSVSSGAFTQTYRTSAGT